MGEPVIVSVVPVAHYVLPEGEMVGSCVDVRTVEVVDEHTVNFELEGVTLFFVPYSHAKALGTWHWASLDS